MISSNKKLIIGLILLIMAGTIVYAIYSDHEYVIENHVSFSLHNDDEIKHEVLVEIFDSTNTSVFKETYIVAPGDEIYPARLKKEEGAYRIEVTLDNNTNNTYIGDLYSEYHDYIHITGVSDQPFMVETAE
ncbi:hypothetical protein [Methanolobus profundi]|uniref:Uncharacterized protein n=1 Tax=Methanolobus profundi TaxID=487685 RepID=A0A1I4RDX8_9EURY|nr:hypothetical protein [Methanolobus profundi]SFM50417.1 hypothetical protein SAMN04488696_1519 [Methanolobus profundi]